MYSGKKHWKIMRSVSLLVEKLQAKDEFNELEWVKWLQTKCHKHARSN